MKSKRIIYYTEYFDISDKDDVLGTRYVEGTKTISLYVVEKERIVTIHTFKDVDIEENSTNLIKNWLLNNESSFGALKEEELKDTILILL